MKPPVKFYFRGPHHGYIGIAFIIFGSVFLWLNWGNNLDALNYIFGAFIPVGAFLVIDDTIEHLVTEDTFCRIIWNKILEMKK